MGEESKKVAAAVVAVSDAEKLALLAEAEAALIGRGAITEYPSVMTFADPAVTAEYGVEVTFAAEDSTVPVAVEIERFVEGVWKTAASASSVPMLNYAALYPGQRRAQLLGTGVDIAGVYRATVKVPAGGAVVSITPVLTPV